MVNTINSTLFNRNFPKPHLNLLKSLKTSILSFYRRYYDPNATYFNVVIKKQFDRLLMFLIDVMFNGFLLYWGIYGLVWAFPKLSSFIFLGATYWHIPVTMFYLGLVSWLFTEYYTYIRTGYKGGKK